MREKVVGLISGGIDSPLAALMVSGSFDVLPLHFCLYPMSSRESSLKAIESLRDLKGELGFERAIVFPWAGVLSEIRGRVRESYACVVCRRAMLVAAGEIGRCRGASGIVTGESLGQKASQTVENIAATSSGIDLPVLRPLIGMNKSEITEMSRKRGIWRADHAGCCLATPRRPRTGTEPEEVDREIQKIDLRGLIEEGKDLLWEVESFDEDFDDRLFRLAGEFE